MSENKTFHYNVKFNIFKDEARFGPGVARLLRLVKENGSLTDAYRDMGLSSSKGWKMIKKAEEDLGFTLIVSTVGGADGGGSHLSDEGELFLKNYESFVSESNDEIEKIFNKYFI